MAACEADEERCWAYIVGFMDGYGDARGGVKICVPKSVTIDRVKKAFERQAKAIPDIAEYSVNSAVATALMTEYPCK
ncbi:hypothetical protein GCM10011390_50310 [Aureimonas endophytica]|uniref:Rap1a immunity protein domain-containing protein n=1 Tax=Aureimonas endophytica TaxID=2027858 RepID=A0A917EER5_9HYPH|nr:hypothetical protein GCM10011390_50310 [Aureimonas endophytica]